MKKLFLSLLLATFTLSFYSCRETTETETNIEEVDADLEEVGEEIEAEVEEVGEEIEVEVSEEEIIEE